MASKTAVIIGAGPAGLTTAYELLTRTDILPIIFENESAVGGLAKTIYHNGNGMDIGPHRFFSKSKRVLDLWNKILPTQSAKSLGTTEVLVGYQNKHMPVELPELGPDPAVDQTVMLVRNRHTRIFFLNKFFDYPLSLGIDTLKKLGLSRVIKIAFSYAKSKCFPTHPEKTFADFLVNRFGNELYNTFFSDYTEKVWGVPCTELSPEWGRQRIQNVSLGRAIAQSLKKMYGSTPEKERSLTEYFYYPKLGAGQMWEELAKKIESLGGKIVLNHRVEQITCTDGAVTKVTAISTHGETTTVHAPLYVFSTMAIQDLGRAIPQSPEHIRTLTSGLRYRNYISIGVLLSRMNPNITAEKKYIPDHWVYVPSKQVRLGRFAVYNNFSPYMVSQADTPWLGLDYFCNEGDALWDMSDTELTTLAIAELEHLGLAFKKDVLDTTVVRAPKAYPSYTGSYNHFAEIRDYFDSIQNLFLLGRNGMHKYNNQDHSMLTAITAVDTILSGNTNKNSIWEVNTDQTYNESEK